jgi:hypothetical protein
LNLAAAQARTLPSNLPQSSWIRLQTGLQPLGPTLRI